MDLYQKQLNYVFNRPIEEPPWYWQPRDEESPFGDEEDALTAFLFYEQLCREPGRDLAPYSDTQVGQGLTYLFDGAVCNLAHGFKKAPVPVKRKVEALRALSVLFKEVMNPRCARVLSAHSQEKSSPLTYICYMFWDVTPLSTWMKFKNTEQVSISFLASLSAEDFAQMNLPEGVRELLEKQLAQSQAVIKTPVQIAADVVHQYQNIDDETEAYYHAIASVMESCLYLDNPACVESGLHGLGHLATFQSGIAAPIIDRFLKTAQKQDVRLLNYAKSARTGMIL